MNALRNGIHSVGFFLSFLYEVELAGDLYFFQRFFESSMLRIKVTIITDGASASPREGKKQRLEETHPELTILVYNTSTLRRMALVHTVEVCALMIMAKLRLFFSIETDGGTPWL